MQDSTELQVTAPSPPFRLKSQTRPSPSIAPKVHLAVFHQDLFGIYDQISFLRRLFSRLGVEFSIGEPLTPDALNLVIENFSPGVCSVLERFHAETGKRIGIIATEHLDTLNGRLLSYGEPLYAPELGRDYITHKERARRFAGLLRASRTSRYLFTLGDYPYLEGIEEVFPRCKVVRLPFPPLSKQSVARRVFRKASHDFVFTGSLTAFRRNVLESLRPRFSIVVGGMAANFSQRARN
jgi:hypothetical protein